MFEANETNQDEIIESIFNLIKTKSKQLEEFHKHKDTNAEKEESIKKSHHALLFKSLSSQETEAPAKRARTSLTPT